MSPRDEQPNGQHGDGRLDIDGAYRVLRARIVNLELAPGARLREEALAAEFGVSRTPIRRVLDWLSHEGLVTITHGAGATVAPIDYRELREVWALRLKVVELIGDFVRLPASPEIGERLRSVLAALDEVDIAEPRSLGPIYDSYHAVMLDIMDNGPLRRIYDQLYAQTARMFVQLLPNLDLAAEVAAVRDEVERSLAACTAGSPKALAEVRAEHMHGVLQRLNASFLAPMPAAPDPPLPPQTADPEAS
ncbi:MAG: GntR family transcriptional regulator [Actinomycetota bacterium]|nr:GntR family transcriptional regulator [Actinomycetota bacterium]